MLKSLIKTFCLFLLSILNQQPFLHSIVLAHRLIFFLIFLTKNSNGNRILFFNFGNVSNFNRKFYIFRIKFSGKIFVSFYNSSGLWSTGCQHPAKHLLKHSSSSVFAISLLDVLIFLIILCNWWELRDCTLKY